MKCFIFGFFLTMVLVFPLFSQKKNFIASREYKLSMSLSGLLGFGIGHYVAKGFIKGTGYLFWDIFNWSILISGVILVQNSSLKFSKEEFPNQISSQQQKLYYAFIGVGSFFLLLSRILQLVSLRYHYRNEIVLSIYHQKRKRQKQVLAFQKISPLSSLDLKIFSQIFTVSYSQSL